MKKSIQSFSIPVLALIMSLNFLTPNTTSAAFLVTGPAVSVVIHVAAGLMAVGYASAQYNHSSEEQSGFSGLFWRAFEPTLIGLIILDDSGNPKAVLQPVSEDAARQAGLSDQETLAYNSGLEITQQVFDQVTVDVSSAAEQDRDAVAKASWEKYHGVISDDAYHALKKLIAAAN